MAIAAKDATMPIVHSAQGHGLPMRFIPNREPITEGRATIAVIAAMSLIASFILLLTEERYMLRVPTFISRRLSILSSVLFVWSPTSRKKTRDPRQTRG